MLDIEKNNKPLDLSYLSEMSGDSPEFMVEMIDMFKQQTPVYISELKKAITDQNWQQVYSCAHKVKPTFAYIGREDAKEHMQLIEHHARDQDNIAIIPSLFEEINAFIPVLNTQLDDAKVLLESRIQA
jgi:HPt (histidine-containing phosphotransfer) domain-containing protein